MDIVTFYEKTGCITNAKQKRLLAEEGIEFEVRSLLEEPWAEDRLRPFFGDLPIQDWFNPNAPEVKSGDIAPSNFDEKSALKALVKKPILIRRPLFKFGQKCWCGFDWKIIAKNLNIPTPTNSPVSESCSKSSGTEHCT